MSSTGQPSSLELSGDIFGQYDDPVRYRVEKAGISQLATGYTRGSLDIGKQVTYNIGDSETRLKPPVLANACSLCSL